MKNTKLILRTVIALCVVMLVLALPTMAQPQQAQLPAVQPGGSIALQPPAFFKTAYAQDAEQAACTPDLLSDAGVMAYIDLQTELDLTSVESLFDAVEAQDEQYILGSFLPPGFEKVPDYDEAAYVQVLVCRDGWIVAYLPKEQLSALLLDWTSYSQRKLKTTPLEDAIRMVAIELGLTIPAGNIAYYDARYPGATGIKLVADSIQGANNDNIKYSEDFQITIPKQLTIYEFSWTYAVLDTPDGASYLPQSECTLNEGSLSKSTPQTQGSWVRLIKALDKPIAMAGKTHTFVLTQYYAGNSFCGVAIVYGEAAK